MINCCDEISDPTPIHVASRIAQDHDPIEAGSFVESDRIEKSWADEKLVIRSLLRSDRIVSGIGPCYLCGVCAGFDAGFCFGGSCPGCDIIGILMLWMHSCFCYWCGLWTPASFRGVAFSLSSLMSDFLDGNMVCFCSCLVSDLTCLLSFLLPDVLCRPHFGVLVCFLSCLLAGVLSEVHCRLLSGVLVCRLVLSQVFCDIFYLVFFLAFCLVGFFRVSQYGVWCSVHPGALCTGFWAGC